ncbi:MAG: hypothetical protein HC898_09830 [Phycisphaerales bacterium]|nr:hypothetical protein [Phycisphaerales bacterium]
MDGYGSIADWHLKQEEGYAAVLSGLKGSPCWKLKIDPTNLKMAVEETQSKFTATISSDASGCWSLRST